MPTEAFTPPQMKPMPAKAASSGSSYPNLVTNQLLDDNTKNKLGSKEVAASTMASKGALVSSNASTTSTAVLEHGQDGFERWVGWGVVAANLIVIGRTLATNHNSLVTVQPGRSIFNFFGLLQRFATEN